MAANGAQLCAAYLRQLLSQPGSYRRRWQRQAVRWRGGDINQSAVAQVLALHMWEAGESNEQRDVLPRELKDRVARALRGEVLSPRTLRLFVDAFEIGGNDASQLWRLLGTPAASMADVASDPDGSYRTLLLHEFHYLGWSGLPRQHRTVQVVQALRAGFDRYPVYLGPGVSSFEVLRGGEAGPIRPVRDDVWRLDIGLGRRLHIGETASFEYRVNYAYDESQIVPPQEFRRAALRRLDNVEIWAQFDDRRLPASVSWTVWQGVDGPAVRAEPVTLDAQHAVHRYLPSVEASVVGFSWRW